MEKIIVTLWITFGDIPNAGWSWGDLVADGLGIVVGILVNLLILI